MEESQHLIRMKRKQMLKSHLQGGCNNSWEERAFAEDTARILGVGGCIWPPRSYSCTFCKREFRSAQALGGHMNVHRRDRARLKQSLSPPNGPNSLGAQFSAQICSSHLDSCLNPNGTITTSTLSPSGLSSSPTQENCGQQKIFSCSASISRVQQKGFPNYSESEDLKSLSCDHVETDLSVGLNSMLGQKLPSGSSCGDDGAINCKRPKTSISSLPVFLKPCSNDRLMAFHSTEIVLGLKPGMEDLDLELRLGKPQKVK